VHERRRAVSQRARVALADAPNLIERSRLAAVDRDQIVAPQEEVDVMRPEAVFVGVEIDSVQDQIEVFAVRFHLGQV
jgi:hypothetical protein